jgi:Xaa-Pro aminopeptidase
LHNTANSAPINKNELVVLDVGASFRGYAADITRVYASSAPSTRQKEVFEAVKAAQAYAISLLGPGVRLKAYEAKVVKFIGEQLKDLGLVNNLKESSVREYFPHATSHFMGLNVHDVGNYQQPLKPGTVLTVEPGIYIKGEGIGVRIEDDVLITNNGVKVLSSDLPSKL